MYKELRFLLRNDDLYSVYTFQVKSSLVEKYKSGISFVL